MRHWLVLAAVYAAVAALVLPGSLLASSDQPTPASVAQETTAPTDSGEGEPLAQTAPATPLEETPSEATPPAEPAPESAPPAPVPAEPAPVEPAPAEPGAAPAEPAPVEPASEDADAAAAAKAKKADKDGKTKAKAAATANVTISDFRFTPATVTVVVGDTVTWTNDGPTAHSATASSGGGFDTGIFPAGESRSATFDEAGTFAYICTPHPNMEGTVVVEAAGSNPAGEEEEAQLENDEEALDEDLEADIDSGALPNTGKDARAMIILGLVMIAIGSVLSLRARRQT